MCLMHCYDMDVEFLDDVFGPTPRTIRRWYKLFITKGMVDAQEKQTNKVEMARGSFAGSGQLLQQPSNFLSGGTCGNLKSYKYLWKFEIPTSIVMICHNFRLKSSQLSLKPCECQFRNGHLQGFSLNF